MIGLVDQHPVVAGGTAIRIEHGWDAGQAGAIECNNRAGRPAAVDEHGTDIAQVVSR